MKKFKEYINEIHDIPVYPDIIKNTSNEFITNYTIGDIKYEFSASIIDDLATISFYEKEKRKAGAIKDRAIKIGALTGVFESINLLLKNRSDVKRFFVMAVDKSLESYNDMLKRYAPKKIKDIKFDYSERDIHGRKCYWYSRKE